MKADLKAEMQRASVSLQESTANIRQAVASLNRSADYYAQAIEEIRKLTELVRERGERRRG